ncbi:hypothetical protein, partial [Serratia fonticola]|uniref:hypothetical protein n=1 Tax=Serratia fonticola TaxID=47917 RepID=UPI0021B75136
RRRGEYKERSADGEKVQKFPDVSIGEMCIRDSALPGDKNSANRRWLSNKSVTTSPGAFFTAAFSLQSVPLSAIVGNEVIHGHG